jgi:hypothetical protein
MRSRGRPGAYKEVDKVKRFVWLMLTLFAVVLPVTAQARWVNEELGWLLSSVGTPRNATGIYVRDTTFNVVAAGQTDTTGTFSLNAAAPWNPRPGLTTLADTSYFAFLVLQSDSTATVANTIISLTYEIDGRMGGLGGNVSHVGWTQVDSTLAKFLNTPTANVVAAPIRAISGIGGAPDAENSINFFSRITAFDDLRIRITSVTGLMTSCRAFVRYWVPDCRK